MPERSTSKRIRIFISSPGDVAAERDALEAVITNDLQQTLGRQHALHLVPMRWESMVTPGMGNIQEKVFAEMGPYDIFVGIFWKRFGTPTGEHDSGSEAEFRQAYTHWERDQSRPILMYFCERPATIDLDTDPAEAMEQFQQAQKVKAFREEVGDKGLYWTYGEVDAFAKMVRNHLYDTIVRLIKEAYQEEADTSPPTTPGSPAPATLPHPRYRSLYLTALRNECRILPLTAIGAATTIAEQVSLDDIYVSLYAKGKSVDEEGGRTEHRMEREAPIVEVREAAEKHQKLVLLGDPGSGKSTFVRQLIVQECTRELDQKRPGLLPVFIALRDLAPSLRTISLAGSKKESRRVLAEHLLNQACAEAKGLGVPECTDHMRHAFVDGSVLLVLDGMDEVPLIDRARVRDCVRAAFQTYNFKKAIVTCRIRSYGGDALLEEFDSYELQPFTTDQIAAFVKAWYVAQQVLKRIEAQKIEGRIADLSAAATNEPLLELAENPMLLTTMTIVHQEETRLPNERVVLYNKAVEILLRRWQEQRGGLPEVLADFLKSDDKVRPVVERLAFAAHSRKEDTAMADLSRDEALAILEEDEFFGDSGLAIEFLDYVDQKSGLLVGRGGKGSRPALYSFPHRTFQEYLAGCYLVGRRTPKKLIGEKAEEGEYWSVAVQLGAEELLYNRRSLNQLLDLAGQLCPREPVSQGEHRQVLWSAAMAETAGVDVVARDEGGGWETGEQYLERCRQRLVEALAGPLPVKERVEAGSTLARLGDPRKEIMTLEAIPFSYVPAGPFLMGDENVEVDVPYGYWISQYPITQAQFKAFIEAGGYEDEQWWTKAGWKHVKDQQIVGPKSYRAPFGVSNHPVVGVSWYEAFAFTRWLTGYARERNWIGSEERIVLPNEPEWEKAARGGIDVPKRMLVDSLSSTDLETDVEVEKNPNPGRRYPWGEEITPEHCNFGEMGIGSTCTPGSFPKGVSPYGLYDMGGNAWGWSRSVWKDNAYPKDRKKWREREDPESGSHRVVRGGSWGDVAGFVRSASRFFWGPGYRYYGLGFRVVRTYP